MWEPATHAFPADRLDEFLLWASGKGASDIAFQTGETVRIERHGRLLEVSPSPLDSVALGAIAEHIAGEASVALLRSGDAIDCSHTVRVDRRSRRRFRVNMSPVQAWGAFGVNVTLRVLPETIPSLDDLGIEPEIVAAWDMTTGLTLVTGVPGSGKSTLLAAGTRRLLERGVGRVHSLEAPIEFVFDGIAGPGALMSSSEIPRHFPSFAAGLRASLRRRPAAVVVGEARDRETVEAVIRAADYGIAVFATAHTIGVAATVRRLVAEFPADERAERAAALVDQTTLVVTQCLYPAPEGGRTAVREWLVFTPALKAELLESASETWPGRIAAELERTGNTLAAHAAAAFAEGRLERRDLARIRAAEPEG